MSIASCSQDDNGTMVMQQFPEIVCWQGQHIVHALFAGAIGIIYVLIACVVALTFYENKMKTDNPLARKDSKAEVSFIINKIVC